MSNKPTDKPVAKPTSTGSVKTSTKYDPSGTVLPVTDPTDLTYLCHKMEAAHNNPYMARNNTPRYQRQVTKWIRQDAEGFNYRFPYCGEVGYNMTKSPPTPIMGEKGTSHRPSTFPLSQYRLMYREYRELNQYQDPVGPYKFESHSLNMINPLVSKTELENTVTLNPNSGNTIVQAYRTLDPSVAQEVFPNGRGILRIPDVIRKTDFLLVGSEGFHPDNLTSVIEVKFPNDSLSEKQREDYLKIASDNVFKFRMITLDQCEYRRRRSQEAQEQELKAIKADPVYIAIGETAMANPRLDSIEAQIALEYEKMRHYVSKWIKEQEIYYSRPQLIAPDNANKQSFQQHWQRYNQNVDAIMHAPLAMAGIVAIAAAAMPAEVAIATGEAITLTRNSATVVQFSARLAAANSPIFAAAAQTVPSAAFYKLEGDSLVYYSDWDVSNGRLPNMDDRLIELDYRYHYPRSHLRPARLIDENRLLANATTPSWQVKVHYYPYQYEYYYYFIDNDPAQCPPDELDDFA